MDDNGTDCFFFLAITSYSAKSNKSHGLFHLHSKTRRQLSLEKGALEKSIPLANT